MIELRTEPTPERRPAVAPNSGAPAMPEPWATVHQSPLPWVNVIALWPIAERGR